MRALTFLPLISSDRLRHITAAVGLALAISGVYIPNSPLRILFIIAAIVCFVLALIKTILGNRFSGEVDFERSHILIVDQTDRESVSIDGEIFKTLGRIEIHVYLKFINETLNDVVIKRDVEGTLLRSLSFGRTKRIGSWVHLANKKPLTISANGESPYYPFKWTIQLPNEFKYFNRESNCFFRIYLSALRRLPMQINLAVEWTGLRTGHFVSK
jgi:hypothetical protein